MARTSAPLFALLCALALTLVGCGGDDKPSSAAAAPQASATARATPAGPTCKQVAAPKPKPDGGQPEPKLELSKAKTYLATVTTSCGTFEITLDAKRAPVTGGSFVTLARDGFYDDLTFHRIVPGFVIQGGDPLGTGAGGPGYSVTETPPATLEYTHGVVAMGKTADQAPGTSASQFFVVTGDVAQLDPLYALLGKVTQGLDVVDAIGALETDAQEKPVSPVVIDSIKITES